MTRSRFASVISIATIAIAMGSAHASPSLSFKTGPIEVTPGHRISEFTTAVDPTNHAHLIVGSIDWDPAQGGVACGIWTSKDGGRTWTRSGSIPGLSKPDAQADPWVSFTPNGEADMTCLEIPGAPTGSLVSAPPITSGIRLVHAHSSDGGATWAQATDIPGQSPGNGRDKESFGVTKTGRIIACATDAPNPVNSLVVYRSDDFGKTWLTPLALNDPDGHAWFGGNCNGVVMSPNGDVHLVGFGINPNGDLDMDVATSHDNGDTWDNATRVDSLTFPSDPQWTAEASLLHPKGIWPTIAVSPMDGTIVISGMYWDFTRNLWWSQLYRSTNDGATFTKLSTPVPAASTCTLCHLSSPAVVFDSHGRLAFQSTLFSNDGGMTRETWLHVSTDNGSTWLNPIMVGKTSGALQNWTNPLTWTAKDPNALVNEGTTLAQDPEEIGGLSSSYAARTEGGVTHHLRYGGDYLGIVATDEGFVSMWNGHTNGYPQIWARIVEVDGI